MAEEVEPSGLELLARTFPHLEKRESSSGYDDSILRLTALFGMNSSLGDDDDGMPPYKEILQMLNNTDGLPSDVDLGKFTLRHRSVSANVLLIVAYTLIVVVSLFGNSLVCRIVWQESGVRSVTYLFIANLAVSDLIITVFNIPINIARNLMEEWVFGSVMCHLLNFTLVTSVYVSTLTMTAICIDRYRVILNPFKQRISRARAIWVLVVVWILGAAFAMPYAVFYNIHETFTYRSTIRCKMSLSSTSRDYLTLITFTTQYVIPLIIIAYAYLRIAYFLRSQSTPPGDPTQEQQNSQANNRRRTIKMLIIVVIVFALCWLPLNTYHVFYAVHPHSEKLISPTSHVYFIFHWFAMSSVCYNPFIYCYLNDKFRAQARRLFRCCFRMSGKIYPGVFYDGALVRADAYYHGSSRRQNLGHTLTNTSCGASKTVSIGLTRHGSLSSSLRAAIYVTSNNNGKQSTRPCVSQITASANALFLNRESTESYSDTVVQENEEPEFEKV